MNLHDVAGLCLGCGALGFVLGAAFATGFALQVASRWLRHAARARDNEIEVRP